MFEKCFLVQSQLGAKQGWWWPRAHSLSVAIAGSGSFATRTQADTELGTVTPIHTQVHTLAPTEFPQPSPVMDRHRGMSRIFPHGQHHGDFQIHAVLLSSEVHRGMSRNQNQGKHRGRSWAFAEQLGDAEKRESK